MTLPEYLTLLRERWVALVLALLVGVAGAYGITAAIPREYSASATMYISSEEDVNGNSSAYDSSLLAKDRVESYKELIVSDRISRDVVNDLALNISPNQLRSKITASSGTDTVLLTATVVDNSPDQAARIANGVVNAFVRLVAQIEQPSDPTRHPPLVARIVEPAVPPLAPVSPRPLINYLLGGLVGLFIGIAGIALHHFVDRSVRSVQQLARATGAPPLGTIAYDRHARRGGLIMRDQSQSERAEDFRKLRTNLYALASNNGGRVIVVTSSVQGEGKSLIVANLAVALGDARNRVLMIDADLRNPMLCRYLGVEATYGLVDVLLGSANVQSAVQTCSSNRGTFDVMDAGVLPSNPSELVSSPGMARLLADLRARYDYVLVDAPAVLPVTDAVAVAHHADGAILVGRYRRIRYPEVQSAVEALHIAGVQVLGSVLNAVPAPRGRQGLRRMRVHEMRRLASSLGRAGQAAVPDRHAPAAPPGAAVPNTGRPVVPSGRNGAPGDPTATRPAPRPRPGPPTRVNELAAVPSAPKSRDTAGADGKSDSGDKG